MKRFESFEGLLESIGVDFGSQLQYAKSELSNFLECEGSDVCGIEDQPFTSFNIEIDGIEYVLGVTSVEADEDEFISSYWIMDINLEGKQWAEVKETLEDFIEVDMSNFDNEGIVDFQGAYSKYSITGKKVNHNDGSYEIVIDDEEKICRNN